MTRMPFPVYKLVAVTTPPALQLKALTATFGVCQATNSTTLEFAEGQEIKISPRPLAPRLPDR